VIRRDERACQATGSSTAFTAGEILYANSVALKYKSSTNFKCTRETQTSKITIFQNQEKERCDEAERRG
jgi:hypothetical protein